VHRLGGELSAIDGEIRDINIRLEDKDKEKPLGKKERDALMFRLGVLTVERVNAQRAYEDTSFLFLGACSGQRSHLSSVPPAAEPL
jgi:hypothetical protein